MKVKLLKKIRKECSIVRIDRNNDPSMWFYGKETPFYVVKGERFWHRLADTYDEAFSTLIDLIRKCYKEGIGRKQRYAETKLWHIQKQHK